VAFFGVAILYLLFDMSRRPRIHAISPVQGTGNRLDLELVCPLLEEAGFDVIRYPVLHRNGRARLAHMARWLASFRGRVDINVFMGPLFPEWLPFAKKNVWIPNPEGFHERHRKFLPMIDLVLAKTKLTENVFRALGRPVEFVGFTSRDRLDAAVPRDYTRFLHACHSPFKGTKRLVENWKEHPEWPELVLVDHPPVPGAANIHPIAGHLPEDQYLRLQNEIGFHLCCSEAEGFGHYIMEALSCGAVALATNGPPMNELVQPSRGILLDCLAETEPLGLSRRYFFKPSGLQEAVQRARDMGELALRQLGSAARAYFLENDRAFRRRFIEMMQSL
jgi:glycosyltransferase involved in cell wall biosynthesis